MESPLLITIVIILLMLMSASSFFGKNLPSFVWWISLISAILLGFLIGAIVAPFPDSIAIGLFISVGGVFLVLIFRISRRNHPSRLSDLNLRVETF